ncbi:MAG: ATP synthase F1 subunit epsilon [Deltaproteobacteria bacterium]|nr:ATP synthase F1 subunit epsilon [Deltaproteobacteria bacterium]
MEEKKSLIRLTLVTPEESVIHSEVVSVVLPGKEGYFEVLSGHTPFLTQIVPGVAIIKYQNEEKELCIADGYASVHDNVVDVIVDSTEWADEIDTERAKKLRDESLKKLSELSQYDAEYRRWENRLKKAEARLELVARKKGNAS